VPFAAKLPHDAIGIAGNGVRIASAHWTYSHLPFTLSLVETASLNQRI
jgi:hypothetical protein